MNKTELLAGAILLTLHAAKPLLVDDEALIEAIEKSGTAPSEPWDLHELIKEIGLVCYQQVARIGGFYEITGNGVAWLKEQNLI